MGEYVVIVQVLQLEDRHVVVQRTGIAQRVDLDTGDREVDMRELLQPALSRGSGRVPLAQPHPQPAGRIDKLEHLENPPNRANNENNNDHYLVDF